MNHIDSTEFLQEGRNKIGLLRFETEIIPRSGSFIGSAVTLATTVSLVGQVRCPIKVSGGLRLSRVGQ